MCSNDNLGIWTEYSERFINTIKTFWSHRNLTGLKYASKNTKTKKFIIYYKSSWANFHRMVSRQAYNCFSLYSILRRINTISRNLFSQKSIWFFCQNHLFLQCYSHIWLLGSRYIPLRSRIVWCIRRLIGQLRPFKQTFSAKVWLTFDTPW